MSGAAKGRGGGKPTGSRARSVGAAGNMHPNGAILGDDAKLLKPRRKQFNEWAERYRKEHLPQHNVMFDYSKSPKPGK